MVSERLAGRAWQLAYQSRSGPPQQAWLTPDVAESLRALAAAQGSRDVVLGPIGFVCEHMETVYDLDVEACGLCGIGVEHGPRRRRGRIGVSCR